MRLPHNLLLDRNAFANSIAILPSTTRGLLHVITQIFHPVLLNVIPILLLFFVLVCSTNSLPGYLAIRQDLLHDVDENMVFVVHSAFFEWHLSDNANEASQRWSSADKGTSGEEVGGDAAPTPLPKQRYPRLVPEGVVV